jgi:hypothetical protein
MSYVPRRGDLVWLSFDPQAGHEQAGRRPAFVLSPETYNRKAGLFLACPVTSKVKGYPFEVVLPDGSDVSGVILSWVLFPILGLAVGLVGPVIKIAIVVGLGWLVLRFFRGSRTSIA